MSRLRMAARAALVLLVAGCSGGDAITSVTPPDDAALTINDAAHSGAVPGFYFLPPMVPNPSFSGTFDNALSPEVQICELVGTVCGPMVVTYTTANGLSVQSDHYHVNWKTKDYNLDPAKTYRISVYVGTFQLGFADVDVVSSGNQLKNVDTQQFIPLLDDKTLPIKFRIETGIPAQVTVTPEIDSIFPGEQTQFTATVTDLHGNPVAATVVWSSSNPAVATVDGNGLATGVSPGTTTITASIGYASDSATLVVENPNTPPVANPDTFDAIGNVTVPVPAPGVLANDTDAELNTLTAVPGTFGTVGGGTVTLNADGSFTYLSAAGFTGVDSWTYQAFDGTDASAPATVTMVVPTRVWYVDNSATAPGDGRDASAFTALNSAEGASGINETIFVLFGDGTSSGYDQGITLQTGQSLTGQGVPADVTVVLNTVTVTLLQAGSAPTVTNAPAGNTIQLATNNTVQGLRVESVAGAGISGTGFGTLAASSLVIDANGGAALDLTTGNLAATVDSLSSTGSAGAGLRLVGVTGSLTAPAGSISGAAGAGVESTGGSVDVDYGGDISGSGTNAAAITGRTGGDVTLSGSISDTGGGILVQGNSGGTIAFTGPSKLLSTGANNGVTLSGNAGTTIAFAGGGLNVATTTGNSFDASTGGTLTVTGANNVLSSAGGTALRVSSVSIGASGLTFLSVSANGGPNGIFLSSTGGTNGLQVTGAGTAGSGGTIQNTVGADGATAGNGVYLSGVTNVMLSWMAMSGTANNGIFGTGVSGLAVDHLRTTGSIGTSNSAVFSESSVHLLNSGGALAVENSRLDGGAWNGFLLRNTAGAPTVDSLVIAADSVTLLQGSLLDTRGSGVQAVIASGTADVRVRDSRVTYWWQNAIHVVVQGTASAVARISDNVAAQTSGAVAGAAGIVVSGGSLQYNIAGNSVQGANGIAISADKAVFGATTMQGTIESNVIGTSGVPNSGSGTGIGIFASHSGTSTTTTRIHNNVLRQINGSANGAITVIAGDAVGGGGSGTMNATVTANNIQESGTTVNAAQHGILVTHGRASGDTDQGCYDIGGAGAAANVIVNFNSASAPAAQNRIRVNQRFNTTSRWPGYLGPATGAASTTAMATYLLSRNTASNSLNANTSTGGFLDTSPPGSACPQPSI